MFKDKEVSMHIVDEVYAVHKSPTWSIAMEYN